MVSSIFLKKTSWQSSLRRLLQKVFQFVLVPVGALLKDFGSFVQHCFWIPKCYASLLRYIQVTVPMSNTLLIFSNTLFNLLLFQQK